MGLLNSHCEGERSIWIGGCRWEGRGARHGRGEGRGAVGMIEDGGVWRG